MARAPSDLDTLDAIGMTLGGGLVLLGTFVFGLFETLLGSPHAIPVTDETGRIVTHTTFSMELRAAIVALGLAVLALYAVARLVRGRPA